MSEDTRTPTPSTTDELATRLLEAAAASWDILSVYLGDRLGLYSSLANEGPATPAQLATRTRTSERYVREWLEHQAVTGFLMVENHDRGVDRARFSLPESHAAALADRDSLAFVAPLGRFLAGTTSRLPDLLDAFRTGGGIEWEAYGEDMRSAQADFNRPFFLYALVEEYLSKMPDLDARLRSPGARVAEVGCGVGWAAIAIGRAYPNARVDGFDMDPPSIVEARLNAEEFDVADRVTFHCQDAGDPAIAGQFDLVFAVECIHDMSNPVAVLATMRRLAAPGGTVLVVDERTAENFTPSGDLLERLLYGYSFSICLPNGLVDQPSAATGTVMRPGTFKAYATEAGFKDARVLPLEHDLFYFYELVS